MILKNKEIEMEQDCLKDFMTLKNEEIEAYAILGKPRVKKHEV